MTPLVDVWGWCWVEQVWLPFKAGLLLVTTCSTKHAGTNTHTHLQVCNLPRTVFLGPIVTVCVTDLISPTICWLEARHRRSYPAWQIQTASVYVRFSQGLTQYGGVESPSWPPNLHPCILLPKDSGAAMGAESVLGRLEPSAATQMNKPQAFLHQHLLKADEQFCWDLVGFSFSAAHSLECPWAGHQISVNAHQLVVDKLRENQPRIFAQVVSWGRTWLNPCMTPYFQSLLTPTLVNWSVSWDVFDTRLHFSCNT